MKKDKKTESSSVGYDVRLSDNFRERLDLWRKLAVLRGKLLVCYRTGQPAFSNLLDGIAETKQRLESLGETEE